MNPNRFFVEHGVKGIFEQGAYQSYGSEMEELRGWLLAKLLWDPKQDADKLVDQFLDGYYGSAAPSIRAYLKLIHDGVDASGDDLGCYSRPDAKFLSFELLAKSWKYLQEAEKAAGEDAALRHRVQVAQLPVLYTFIVRWHPLHKDAKKAGVDWPLSDSIQTVYEQFMKTAVEEKVTMMSEGSGIDGLKPIVDKAATRPAK